MADPLTILVVKFLLAVAAQQMAQGNSPPQAPTAAPSFNPEGPTIPELAEAVLHCYHPSGRFRTADVLESPWARGSQYEASKSALLRIDWSGGLVGKPYAMVVALIERDGMVRAVVQGDDAVIPRSKTCSLEHWTQAQE